MRRPSSQLKRFLARARRVTRFLPWLSLGWGIASGFMIARVYAKAVAVLAYTIVFILLSATLVLWLKWLELMHEKRTAGRKAKVADFFFDYVIQTAFQYVVMFMLPFLYLSQAFLTLGAAILALATTLWGAWWARLSRSTTYLCGLRVLCGGLGLAFCLAVFRPDLLNHFYPIVWGGVTLLAIPFEHFYRAKNVRARHYVLAAGLGAMVATGLGTGTWLPFPLVATWLRHPALGIGVDNRELIEVWPAEIPYVKIDTALIRGDAICCTTPLVSPRGLNLFMTHEWYANARLIDRIPLKELTTSEANEHEAHPFRMHSCKRHFPDLASVLTLTCRAVLGGGIVVGSVAVRID